MTPILVQSYPWPAGPAYQTTSAAASQGALHAGSQTKLLQLCGKGDVASKHLVEDEAIRSAVREFRILPERPELETFTGKSFQQTPSFSQLSSQQPS
jgi:hypothetical protein